MPLLLKFLGCAVPLSGSTTRRLVALLALGGVVGCYSTVRVAPEPFPNDFTSVGAEWEQRVQITRFAGYGPDELFVISEISDRTPTIRYMIAIRVASLGVKYGATQDYGSESETLERRLRAGETQETLYADFDHSVRRNGTLWLRFAGTTLLPRWSSE